jgi:hypothetical protein
MSGLPSEERERLEENLADVEEATEQRMHSVADLIPETGQEIPGRADRLSETQRSTAVEFSAAAPMTTNGMVDGLDPAKISANLPVFEQIAKSAWTYCVCTSAGARVSE